MKSKKIFTSIFIFFYIFTIVLGQGVAINETNSNPDNTSILDVSSNEKGILIPRLTTTQRDAISSAAQSLLIYNITTKCFEFWENGNWHELGCAVIGWSCGDTLLDERDGKKYATVEIGNQCWFLNNLAYNSGCTGASWIDASDVGWCGWNQGDEITQKYGLLYQWSAIINGETPCNGTGAVPNDACTTPIQGLCPNGWHLPSPFEWRTLQRQICIDAGNANCDTQFPYDGATGWKGTDEGYRIKVAGITDWSTDPVCGSSGFDALPSGYRTGLNGSYQTDTGINLYSY